MESCNTAVHREVKILIYEYKDEMAMTPGGGGLRSAPGPCGVGHGHMYRLFYVKKYRTLRIYSGLLLHLCRSYIVQ